MNAAPNAAVTSLFVQAVLGVSSLVPASLNAVIVVLSSIKRARCAHSVVATWLSARPSKKSVSSMVAAIILPAISPSGSVLSQIPVPSVGD